jgi:cell division protein YceG involved in septum cleavage
MLAACSGNGAVQPPIYIEAPTSPPVQPSITPQVAPVNTAQPSPQASDGPVKTEPVNISEASPSAFCSEGTIIVRDGDTLERDIIPQLTEAFSLSEGQVKDMMANAKNSLIGEATGFRRMEGLIVPGTYELNGGNLEYWIQEWITGAEARYDLIASEVPEKNGLFASERITLASIVEGDTNLADSYEDIAAAVYLNRIEKNDKFGSCPTVEYALGYGRPYLTTEDTKIDSKYNTYEVRGLPPGPICCFDDESLKASISNAKSELYFFFYDYVKREILSFVSYEDFKAAGKESKELFESTFDISRFEKMEDKREYFSK